MFRLLKSTFLSIFLFGSLFLVAHAQTSGITLQVSPEFPRPNSQVTIIAASNSVDLSTASFTWYLNGKVTQKGKGLTSANFVTGKAGVLIRVSVDINTLESGLVSRQVNLRPVDVSLVWKSDGYVPPFYKGKALETYGSEFKVTAIPEFFTSNGARVNPKTLVYTWKKNGTIDPEQSGYGKDVYSGRQTSYTRGEDEISVLVSTPTDDMSSGQRIILTPTIPEILFYENSPLYGVLYEKALGNRHVLGTEELTLHASLFDMSVPNMGLSNNSITIDWFLNGASLSDFRNKSEVTLRKTSGVVGESLVEMSVQHQNRLLQGGQAGITILQ